MKNNFAKNLKFYLKSKKITQKDFSKMIGVSASTIYSWLNNKSTPRATVLLVICPILNISADNLILSDLEKMKMDLFS